MIPLRQKTLRKYYAAKPLREPYKRATVALFLKRRTSRASVQRCPRHSTRSRVASANIPVIRSLPLREIVIDPLGPTGSAKRVEEDPVLRQPPHFRKRAGVPHE